ncbi:hypothetical protein Sa4125_15280 [Aureimonas sp. SA4125]|nr:hypothetical protein Sa4125_15280 [Aureimonas sp. SA4125]
MIFDDGLVLILKELHDRLAVAVAEAYGWPVDLPEEDLLGRLVALNKERAKEEKRGLVSWLRPDYHIPCFARKRRRPSRSKPISGARRRVRRRGPGKPFRRANWSRPSLTWPRSLMQAAP